LDERNAMLALIIPGTPCWMAPVLPARPLRCASPSASALSEDTLYSDDSLYGEDSWQLDDGGQEQMRAGSWMDEEARAPDSWIEEDDDDMSVLSRSGMLSLDTDNAEFADVASLLAEWQEAQAIQDDGTSQVRSIGLGLG
jgi:hypothetical protein